MPSIVVQEREVARGRVGAILAIWLGVERRKRSVAVIHERRGATATPVDGSNLSGGFDPDAECATDWSIEEPELEWLGI